MSTLQAPSKGVRAIAAGEPNKYIVRKSAENPARMRLRFIPGSPVIGLRQGAPDTPACQKCRRFAPNAKPRSDPPGHLVGDLLNMHWLVKAQRLRGLFRQSCGRMRRQRCNGQMTIFAKR